MNNKWFEHGLDCIDSDEARSNAALINTAPEMLEALKKIRDDLQHEFYNQLPWGDTSMVNTEQVEQLTDLINKATNKG